MHQTNDRYEDYLVNNRKFKEFKAKDIDFVFVTHNHIDHVGLIPKLYRDGFRGATIVSENSKQILKDMILDSAYINERDVLVINSQHNKNYKPLYSASDVYKMLEYTLEKNKGLYFDITSSSKKLNEKVFVDKGFLTDIQSSLTKFWGKHSLLAILQHETNDKTSSYFDSAISKQFQICLADLMNLSCKVKCPNTPERGVIGLVHPMLSDLDRGDIRIEQGTELMRVEAMLNCFLPKISKDIIGKSVV